MSTKVLVVDDSALMKMMVTRMLAKVKSVAEAPRRSLIMPTQSADEGKSRHVKEATISVGLHRTQTQVERLLAIGTSTGGPRALQAVLQELPNSISFPILVVQHMPPKFTRSFANRLNAACDITVVEARHNQPLQNGTAYIAPGGFHMTLERREGQYRILLNEHEKRNEHRPSVDVLFESLARLTDVPRYLVLMTGMGSDGAVGMEMAKRSGATTMAEAKETCIIYGMPKSAIERGCVDYVVPLYRIAERLLQLMKS